MTPVFLNMRHLTQPLSGMQRFAEELTGALDERLAREPGALGGRRVVGLAPPGALRRPAWRAIEIRELPGPSGHLWEQWSLWRASRDGALISLAGSGPLAHPRHLLVLHDANVFANPAFYSRFYRLWHGLLRPRLARRARGLATISHFSQAELARWCGVDPARFTIISDSAEHVLSLAPDETILDRHGLERGRYALCVGNQSPNKNIALAVEAFRRARPPGARLAVAGGAVAQLASADIGEAEWLVRLGRVTDEELRALYENAALFLFPSVYEGFGVPPLEAMALGCPVAAARRSAMPEVLGDAALYFEGDDADDCAARIHDVFALAPAARQTLVEMGRDRAAMFSWRRGADTLIEAITALG